MPGAWAVPSPPTHMSDTEKTVKATFLDSKSGFGPAEKWDLPPGDTVHVSDVPPVPDLKRSQAQANIKYNILPL